MQEAELGTLQSPPLGVDLVIAAAISRHCPPPCVEPLESGLERLDRPVALRLVHRGGEYLPAVRPDVHEPIDEPRHYVRVGQGPRSRACVKVSGLLLGIGHDRGSEPPRLQRHPIAVMLDVQLDRPSERHPARQLGAVDERGDDAVVADLPVARQPARGDDGRPGVVMALAITGADHGRGGVHCLEESEGDVVAPVMACLCDVAGQFVLPACEMFKDQPVRRQIEVARQQDARSAVVEAQHHAVAVGGLGVVRSQDGERRMTFGLEPDRAEDVDGQATRAVQSEAWKVAHGVVKPRDRRGCSVDAASVDHLLDEPLPHAL